MEDRETPRMRKYGESKTTRIMMATVPHVTSGSGLRRFQADGFLFNRVYIYGNMSLNSCENVRWFRQNCTENQNTHFVDFSKYQLNAQFLYSSTICMLHYAPQHVSSSTLLILRRTNCITTASGIVKKSDDTRGCGDTIGPPDDEQRAARNMLRSIV